MVTAIVIPVICLYFYWLTKKEMNENDAKWASVGRVEHEAIVTGEIKSIVEEKQKFYNHRYIYVQTLKLQTESKIIIVQKITPITKDFHKEDFRVGDVIRVMGKWDNSKFLFTEYVIEKR
ncbi:hypothetical protein [Neobacillus drentensis]|uniref:hypothetical protein n=1 Tax=Neobacillus drentensis TaxID=220684 RepID=UPI0030006788